MMKTWVHGQLLLQPQWMALHTMFILTTSKHAGPTIQYTMYIPTKRIMYNASADPTKLNPEVE